MTIMRICNTISSDLRRFYSLVLKEGFEVCDIDISSYKFKTSPISVNKISVTVDGYHDHDYKHYKLTWFADGHGTNFDFPWAIQEMQSKIMEQMMVPSKILMSKELFEDIIDSQEGSNK